MGSWTGAERELWRAKYRNFQPSASDETVETGWQINVWIPDSGFLTFHKAYKNMADSNFTIHRLLPLLRCVKTIATWKTVIDSMQSLGMDNYRVAFTRFLAFYSDNTSGLRNSETPAKWQNKASFATHPSTDTEWQPKLLTRFSSWRIELHNDMQESL